MRSAEQQAWLDNHTIRPEWLALARRVMADIRAGAGVMDALRTHPLAEGGYLGKYVLVAAYHQMVRTGELRAEHQLLEHVRMKPVRTLSGVTTVTVLTKPYPCPGECVFCPTDARMPKSYLPDEPGAMRGLEHDFDPYPQVKSRLLFTIAAGLFGPSVGSHNFAIISRLDRVVVGAKTRIYPVGGAVLVQRVPNPTTRRLAAARWNPGKGTGDRFEF